MDLLCALGWVGKREVTPIVCSESIADGKLPLAIRKFHAVNLELPPRVAGVVVQWVELLHDVAMRPKDIVVGPLELNTSHVLTLEALRRGCTSQWHSVRCWATVLPSHVRDRMKLGY